MIEREPALNLLKKYNKDSFHLRHALTVEHMMRWYAAEEGYKDEQDFWGLVGLLHDIHALEHIVQNSQIGRLAAGYAGTIGALPCAQCTFIIFQHKNSFFL